MKRTEKFNFVNKAKKAKLEEPDDIWGDDPEIDEVDECINLATQLCSQNLPVESLTLASYDDFKPKPDVYTSTQAFLQPSTSRFKFPKENILNSSISSTASIKKDVTPHKLEQDLMFKIQHLEQQNKKLKSAYEAKDGEIAILRTTLRNAQKAVDVQKLQNIKAIEENQQTWNTKFNSTTKDVTSLKCELNLKDLEISNLRDKLLQSKKIVNSNLNMSIFTEEMNLTQLTSKRPATISSSTTKISKQIQVSLENEISPHESGIYYPLHDLIPNSIFEKCPQENSTIQLKSIAKSSYSAFRHNFSMTQCDSVICLNPLISTDNSGRASITSLYPDLSKLMNYTEEELNSNIAIKSIGKIVFITRELLSCLLKKLQKIEDVSFDDIEDLKMYLEQQKTTHPNYCIFSGTPWCENEAAIDLRRCISIVATLSLNCNIVSKYLTDDLYNDLNLNEFSILLKSDRIQKYEFLNILLEITTIIKKIRRVQQFSGLLASIVKLLNNLTHRIKLPVESYNLIANIFRQIIFTRPNKPVFKYICEFLKTVSKHCEFVPKLCSLSTGPQKKAITNDTCTFRVLATELETCDVDTHMACNVIHFLNNTINCNAPWMYHHDKPRCDCLVQVYSLAIEILYNSLEDYLTMNLRVIDSAILQSYYTIFRIGLIFLNILTIRIPDLVVRCSRLYSQYQTIIKNISAIKDDLNFESGHDLVLENLICQLNSEDQKDVKIQSNNSRMESLFNNSFTTF